jgi:hypothetical protein
MVLMAVRCGAAGVGDRFEIRVRSGDGVHGVGDFD